MTDETTVTGFAILSDAHTLRFERDLDGPIERVWAYLTESDLKATWIGPGEIPPEIGGEHTVTWDGEDGQPGGGLTLRTRVFDPPRVLEYDWVEHGAPGGAIGNSVVRFELSAKGDRVRLTLTHSALPTESYTTIGAGWHAHLDTLVLQVAGQDGPDANARYSVIGPRYGALASFPSGGVVRFERVLATPVDRVWSYLTEPALLATWLATGRVPSSVGEQFTLTMLANGDEIAATLTEYDPPRTIAYSWFSLHHESPHDNHSVVRYELSPHDDGTLLVLTHSSVQHEFYGRSAAGWHSLLDGLSASIDGAPVPAFTSIFPRVIDAYEDLAREAP